MILKLSVIGANQELVKLPISLSLIRKHDERCRRVRQRE